MAMWEVEIRCTKEVEADNAELLEWEAQWRL